MHDKEFESVLSLAASRRYEYFIKKVADWGRIWSLKNKEGWVLAGVDQGHELIPVWPHERFALACATESWADCEPSSIDIAAWLERWMPGALRDHRLVAVFPTASIQGVVVSPERLKEDLESELSLTQ